ncbi:hypothetical protein FE845_18150 [Marinobacter sp. 1-4A]|uniref:hypothetical protein n=1 Tax=Marinobacter sp. 1-4A TaxID=2582919 RepID=UPI001908A5A3|nr:hypothetical protein [Marinobacter sp. 1-4A]MBK1853273.1 hypothetical protein [Marinobacter sp. 1-4A]
MRLLILLLISITPILGFGDQGSSLNSDVEDESKYFLAFISRESDGVGPGHAYVAWGVEDYEKQMSTGEAYGFYPQDGKAAWGVFKDVNGNILNEAFNAPSKQVNNHLLLSIEKDVYDSTKEILNKWEQQELKGELKYNLLSNNCINFVNNVALAAGLIVPETDFQLPKLYLESLIHMNKMRPNPPSNMVVQ